MARLESIERMLDAGMFPPKAMTSLIWLAHMIEKLEERVIALEEAVADLAEYDSVGER